MDTTQEAAPRAGEVVRTLPVRAIAGMAIAAVGALILLLIATATGQDLRVQVGTRPPQQVTGGAILSVILLSGVAAWGAAALAARLVPRPRAAFVAAAVLALAVSLVPPATAATGAATWWLEAMHLVVFMAVVTTMAPAIPSRSVTGRSHRAVQADGGAA